MLVGGVGYRDLRDHSAGPAVADLLAGADLPPFVRVEDLSYNPVAVAQRLDDERAAGSIGRALLVAAVARGRPPGTVTAYRWDGVLPDAERIQDAVAEAVTGVIALDNTLVVVQQLGGWPGLPGVVEIEPAVEEFGDSFTAPVELAVERAVELLSLLAADQGAFDRLPLAPLGGGALPRAAQA